jgi:hypothetical protein
MSPSPIPFALSLPSGPDARYPAHTRKLGWLAIKDNNAVLLDAAIEAGFDVNAEDTNGHSCITVAAGFGHRAIMDILDRTDSSWQQRILTTVDRAMESDQAHLMDFFKARGMRVARLATQSWTARLMDRVDCRPNTGLWLLREGFKPLDGVPAGPTGKPFTPAELQAWKPLRLSRWIAAAWSLTGADQRFVIDTLKADADSEEDLPRAVELAWELALEKDEAKALVCMTSHQMFPQRLSGPRSRNARLSTQALFLDPLSVALASGKSACAELLMGAEVLREACVQCHPFQNEAFLAVLSRRTTEIDPEFLQTLLTLGVDLSTPGPDGKRPMAVLLEEAFRCQRVFAWTIDHAPHLLGFIETEPDMVKAEIFVVWKNEFQELWSQRMLEVALPDSQTPVRTVRL